MRPVENGSGDVMSDEASVDRRCKAGLAALTAAYVVVMLLAQFHKLEGLEMGFDLALQEQVLWNTIHGRWLETSTLAATRIDLGRDLILLDFLAAVPYRLLPDVRTLLALQTLAIAAGVVPLYGLARPKLGPVAALLVASTYLAYKPLHFLNLYEFQIRAFALAPLLGMFHFLEERRLGPFVACIGLALCTRSDIALVVAMFGAYALLARRPRPFGLSALLMGALWFVLAVGVVVPRFNGGGELQYLAWYGKLGHTPWEAVGTVVTHPGAWLEVMASRPKLILLATVFGLLGFLPLLQPRVLLVGLPTLGMVLLSDRPTLASIRKQYPAALYPVAFAGLVLAIEMLCRLSAVRRRRLTSGALAAAVLTCNVITLYVSPPTTWQFLGQWTRPPSASAVDRLVAKIPAEASLAVSSKLAPLVARRQHLFLFPPQSEGFYSEQALVEADYVLYETGSAGSDKWLAILDQPPWALIGVGLYEAREYKYRYRLYRRRRDPRAPDAPAALTEPARSADGPEDAP